MLWLRNQEDSDDSNSLKPLLGTEDYVAATDIYKDERYAEAQKAATEVASDTPVPPVLAIAATA